MLRKLFARRADDRQREEVVSRIIALSIGDLGPHDSMMLALYCVSAIAGHVIQQTTLADRMTRGLPHQAPDVVAVGMSTGRTYVFGDAIAAALLRAGEDPGILHWLAAQARVPFDPVAIQPWFAQSAESVGGPAFGVPSTPLDGLAWPAIDAVIGNADAVIRYLAAGGLGPTQFEPMLTNVARVALLRAIDAAPLWTPAQLVRLASEVAIASSHILPTDQAAT